MTDTSGPDAEARAADYALSLRLDDLPPEVRDRARLVLLDTVGVCVRGARTDYVESAARDPLGLHAGAPTGGRGATALPTMARRPPAEAALLNAAAGTTLELDEGNQRSGHPGIHAVPPALAVAEHRGATGEELLAALVAGYEVGARFGDAVRPMREGLHPHGAWAAVAGAVATGRLVGLDAGGLAAAVRMAVTPFVVGHWRAAREGATVRDFYTGLSVAHGVRSASLAAAGVTGVEGATADCMLPYAAAGGAGGAGAAAALEAVTATLGEEYYLADSYVKIHAACRYTHAPIEALGALLSAGVDPDDVERVTVRTFDLGATLDGREPHNPLSAKFSTPYALAARAVLGHAGPGAFAPDRVADERLRRFARRVAVTTDPAFEERAAEGLWGAAVTVELADGTTQTETVRDARGGGENPFTREEVLAKFDGLVGDAVDPESAAALRERLLGVESVDDAGALLDPIRG